MSENIEELEENNQDQLPSIQRQKDIGLWIAIVAIIISLVTAFISLYEANLMKKQQDIMMEQRSASAWPYIQISTSSEVTANKVNLKLSIENKGVGPAILQEVQHYVNGSEVETYNYVNKLEEIYPEFQYSFIRNQQIDNAVMSAKEKFVFLEFNIEAESYKNTRINELIANLNKEIKFCYCSIYKECWQYEHNNKGELIKCK